MRMKRIDKETKILYPELSYILCGLCFKVHNKLGRFRNEKQYADALEKLLEDSNIKYYREKFLPPSFDGERMNRNKPDFIIDDKIIIDLKVKRIITKDDYFQMQRYLASSNKKLGIIINFQQKFLNPKRVLKINL